MVYKGHVENGAIILDEPADLPEGALVRVELAGVNVRVPGQAVPSLAESLSSVIGEGPRVCRETGPRTTTSTCAKNTGADEGCFRGYFVLPGVAQSEGPLA